MVKHYRDDYPELTAAYLARAGADELVARIAAAENIPLEFARRVVAEEMSKGLPLALAINTLLCVHQRECNEVVDGTDNAVRLADVGLGSPTTTWYGASVAQRRFERDRTPMRRTATCGQRLRRSGTRSRSHRSRSASTRSSAASGDGGEGGEPPAGDVALSGDGFAASMGCRS